MRSRLGLEVFSCSFSSTALWWPLARAAEQRYYLGIAASGLLGDLLHHLLDASLSFYAGIGGTCKFYVEASPVLRDGAEVSLHLQCRSCLSLGGPGITCTDVQPFGYLGYLGYAEHLQPSGYLGYAEHLQRYYLGYAGLLQRATWGTWNVFSLKGLEIPYTNLVQRGQHRDSLNSLRGPRTHAPTDERPEGPGWAAVCSDEVRM